MKCRRCREPAVIDVRRHNAGFCRDCFLHHCREQVRKTIDDFDMIGRGDRVLIAVSGGKDSLALWDILLDLDIDASGLYLGLGIGDYSDNSGTYARDFAARRQAPLVEIDLPTDVGFDIPSGAARARRVPCSGRNRAERSLRAIRQERRRVEVARERGAALHCDPGGRRRALRTTAATSRPRSSASTPQGAGNRSGDRPPDRRQGRPLRPLCDRR